jgi:competence protein ComGC
MHTTIKVKAFTLSEVIVVLILTSIVVGMAFSVLTLIKKQMLFIENNYAKNSIVNQLEYQLWLDFNNYHNISFDQNSNELQLKTAIDSLVYEFNEKTIIKDNDTLRLDLRNVNFYYKGNLVSDGHIDAIKLGLSKEDKSKNIFVFKYNDATHYINE